VPVTFVGEGPESTSILRENPSAQITGWVRPEQVHAQLRMSRAFVIPSIWYECSPLVTVEAQSHGLPVVCSDTNASRDSVDDGVTGLHFRSGNAEDLAEKLKQLSDAKFAENMSEATYAKFWADPPSTERHIQGLLGIYRQMLGN
jgi:glycosyltransferase involved in cell wall biosynthesis